MFRLVRQTLAILMPLTLLLSGCAVGGDDWDFLDSSTQPVATLSPYLELFRSHGFDVPDDTQVIEAFAITLDGEHYEVLEYLSSAGNGLQIKQGDSLLQDADTAFRVLLSYAWTPQYHGVDDADLASLRELQSRVQNGRQEYDAFFRFAESLAPIMEQIDELENREITGVPIVSIGEFTIIDIANWWDLICTIPVDIFDLCLLEPPLRAVYEQGMEIELLLQASNEDMLRVIAQLDAQANGQMQDGLALKESMEKTISGLNNLLWKLDEFAADMAGLQVLTREAITALETRGWGPKVEKTLAIVESVTGADSASIIDSLLLRLQDLDQKMSTYLTKSDEIAMDIERCLAILMGARVRTDEALQTLGEQWRARPESR